MSNVLVSLDEWRVAKGGIKITFFKVIAKVPAVESHYPGGLSSFVDGYQHVTQKGSLVALTFTSTAQVEECVEALEKTGMRSGADIATANQIHGALVECPGISFHSVDRAPKAGTHQSFPVWYACSE